MPTIRQLIQTSPAKANELFAKLAETSGNAVKTRERLFAELKEELELQMRRCAPLLHRTQMLDLRRKAQRVYIIGEQRDGVLRGQRGLHGEHHA